MTIAPAADHGQIPGAPGFVGKLPSHGDFISRRLPTALLVPWETWLDAALERSRETLGEGWLKAYLSSPIWCFSLEPGCCGDRPVAGVMMPSLDRIGRYYPLTIMAPVQADRSATAIALGATAWFTRMEALALSCLADDFDFERFDTSISDDPFPSSESCESTLGAGGPGASLALLLSDLIRNSGVPYSVWWTSGSPPRYRVFRGLPPAEEFAQLLL
jgi:type VI secretion system protein ImpM